MSFQTNAKQRLEQIISRIGTNLGITLVLDFDRKMINGIVNGGRYVFSASLPDFQCAWDYTGIKGQVMAEIRNQKIPLPAPGSKKSDVPNRAERRSHVPTTLRS